MRDGERLVAEQAVQVHGGHVLSVRISENPAEDFWRVDVENPSASRGAMTTTVSEGDSFLMHLICGALDGQESAWRRLAEWGHDNLRKPAPGFRLAPAAV